MKIKIKIKTLILTVFVLALTFILAIPTATLMIAGFLDDRGSEKASLFYERYASYATTPNIKSNYLYADSLVKSFTKYTIFFTGWGGGANTSPEDMDKAKQILIETLAETPVKNSEKDYYIKSYKMLLDIAIATGDARMLREWIDFGQEVEDEKLIYTADIYEGFLHHVNGESEAAKRVLEKYEDTESKDISYDVLKAEIALFDGKYEEVETIYEDLYKNNWRELGRSFGSGAYDRGHWFEGRFDDLKGDSILRGTVTYEGKPMPFVEIYVQEATGGLSLLSRGESYAGITDENGQFRTLGLKEGLYNVGIGVDGSILTDKELQSSTNKYVELDEKGGEIHFIFRDTLKINSPKLGEKLSGDEFTVSWEEVENAAYYTVGAVVFYEPFGDKGISTQTYLKDLNGEYKFTETNAVFNINLFRNNPNMNVSDSEKEYLGAQAVLGIFLPGVEYPIVVNAFDENNNLITRSLPKISYYDQIPGITVEGSLTEGENLIYHKNYIEALEYYENILTENPDDTAALRYLTRIYGIGWKEGEQNLKRAFELGQRYSEISGDWNLLINTVAIMDMSEIKENSNRVFEVLTEAMKDPNFDNYSFLSRYYIAVEDYEKARETLREWETVTDTLIFLNIYFGDYMEASKNIKSESFYISRLSSNRVKGALEALDKNPPGGEELKIFNDFLLKLISSGIPYDEGKNVYNETVKQISNSNIKSILDEIFLERHWDTEY
ncbi:MAG: hypothetical protein KBA11_09755 [Sedimentibacter sp.]|nr:hypothetical protein [Sedimentibacter sp.]